MVRKKLNDNLLKQCSLEACMTAFFMIIASLLFGQNDEDACWACLYIFDGCTAPSSYHISSPICGMNSLDDLLGVDCMTASKIIARISAQKSTYMKNQNSYAENWKLSIVYRNGSIKLRNSASLIYESDLETSRWEQYHLDHSAQPDPNATPCLDDLAGCTSGCLGQYMALALFPMLLLMVR